jgi:NHLM bacteriocin system ABC transporter ATP-binding protein
LSLEPGETLALDQAKKAYAVTLGKIEIYAILVNDGVRSGRHFLLPVGRGGLIAPLATATGKLALIAVAIEATQLNPISLTDLASQAVVPEQRSRVAGELDGWIEGLAAAVSLAVGPPPADTTAVTAGPPVPVLAGAAVTSRSGVAWFDSSNAPLYCGAKPLAEIDASPVIALAGGTWLAVTAPGSLTVQTTAEILAQPQWPRRLGGVHACMFAVIADALRARDTAARAVLETRTAGSGRTLQRMFARFDGVLGPIAPQTTMAHAADEPLVAPFISLAAVLGIDLTGRQRDLLARCRTVDEAARAVRLRNRPVALRGNWRQQDLGPLIGFLDEERRAVALIPGGAGKWRMVETEGAKPVPINDALAARVAPTAQMLYVPFADKPIGLRDYLGFGWLRNRRDVLVAIAMSIGGALLGLATPFAMQLAFDRFIPGHEIGSLAILAAGLVLAAVIAAGFRVVYDMAFLRLDGRSAGALQAAIMDRVLRLPDYTLRMSPGDLASRVAATDALRRNIYGALLGSLSSLFFWLGNIVAMFYYSPAAAGAAVGLFVLLSVIATLSGHRQVDSLRRGEELMADIYNIVYQFVQGITVLRSTGAEERAFARWGMDFADLRARSYRARSYGTLFETSIAAFELCALAAIFVILAYMPREDLSTGAFIAFISAYGTYMGSSLQIARSLVGLWNAKPMWFRATPLLRAVPEGAGAKRNPGKLRGAIELTGVYYRYGPEAPFALQGVSLSIAPGEFVALVGPSGSGKSTLMRLLLGFEMPLGGAIQYDQQDLRFLDLELVRRQIGVVLQNSTLFPGTLYENIMGVSDGTLDDAWSAARQAGIEADIRAMPMGMHTVVTEASSAFSGGQIQRLAIARALVSKPRILLLDEATSAVDNLTQSKVTESLEQLAVTRLVIAHRLVTVKKANRIVVLDHGKVAQIGRFDELAAAPGLFGELVRRQLL